MSNMNMEQCFAFSLERQLRLALKMLRKGSPRPVLANTMASIFMTTTGYCGQDFFEALGRRAIADVKRQRGFCTAEGCTNRINPSLGDMPVCERCDHKEDQADKQLDEDRNNMTPEQRAELDEYLKGLDEGWDEDDEPE